MKAATTTLAVNSSSPYLSLLSSREISSRTRLMPRTTIWWMRPSSPLTPRARARSSSFRRENANFPFIASRVCDDETHSETRIIPPGDPCDVEFIWISSYLLTYIHTLYIQSALTENGNFNCRIMQTSCIYIVRWRSSWDQFRRERERAMCQAVRILYSFSGNYRKRLFI